MFSVKACLTALSTAVQFQFLSTWCEHLLKIQPLLLGIALLQWPRQPGHKKLMSKATCLRPKQSSWPDDRSPRLQTIWPKSASLAAPIKALASYYAILIPVPLPDYDCLVPKPLQESVSNVVLAWTIKMAIPWKPIPPWLTAAWYWELRLLSNIILY